MPTSGKLWTSILKITLFLVSVFLFILAIELMKNGAKGLGSLFETNFKINNLANALGFGWLFAYFLMSGSPVATSSLAFLDVSVVDRLGAFAMIIGSRLGASFIVIFIGFIYLLRGHERRSALTMGLLSLIVTSSVYLPAFGAGILLLESRIIDSVQLASGTVLSSSLDHIFAPIIGLLSQALPVWSIFFIGLGIILLSFKLFDRSLPDFHLEKSEFAETAHVVYHPVVMLALGAGLTLLTMSVSLSLSLLIPLSTRGYVRKENVIPYIMGANITTFIDTLLTSVLLGNPDAFTVVLVCALSVALISLLFVVLGIQHYERVMLRIVDVISDSNRNLAIFMVAIFVMPLILFLV